MLRCTALILLAFVSTAQAREFTSRSGYKFEAQIVSIGNDHVVLSDASGSVSFPKRLLSIEDQRFLIHERNRRGRAAAKQATGEILKQREAYTQKCLKAQEERRKAEQEKLQKEKEAKQKAEKAQAELYKQLGIDGPFIQN